MVRSHPSRLTTLKGEDNGRKLPRCTETNFSSKQILLTAATAQLFPRVGKGRVILLVFPCPILHSGFQRTRQCVAKMWVSHEPWAARKGR